MAHPIRYRNQFVFSSIERLLNLIFRTYFISLFPQLCYFQTLSRTTWAQTSRCGDRDVENLFSRPTVEMSCFVLLEMFSRSSKGVSALPPDRALTLSERIIGVLTMEMCVHCDVGSDERTP